jgi:hypothetical protein
MSQKFYEIDPICATLPKVAKVGKAIVAFEDIYTITNKL